DNAEHAQAEAVRLATVNKVLGLIVDNGVSLDERIGRTTQPYQLAVVSPARIAEPPASDNLFTITIGQQQHARLLARFASEESKAKQMVLIADARRPGSTSWRDTFTRAAPQGRVQELTFNDPAELPTLAGRVQKDAAYVLAVSPGDFALVREKLEAREIRGPW